MCTIMQKQSKQLKYNYLAGATGVYVGLAPTHQTFISEGRS